MAQNSLCLMFLLSLKLYYFIAFESIYSQVKFKVNVNVQCRCFNFSFFQKIPLKNNVCYSKIIRYIITVFSFFFGCQHLKSWVGEREMFVLKVICFFALGFLWIVFRETFICFASDEAALRVFLWVFKIN